VDVIKGHEEYHSSSNIGRIEASVWDAAALPPPESDVPYSLPEGIQPASVDIILLIFIFSALSPQQWTQALLNLQHALKPGGTILFRDYGRGDLAQVRFKKGRWMGENFYVRGDGTRVYFFGEEELRDIWGKHFEVEKLAVDRRMLVNRQRRLRMYRCWMQAVFRKPGGDGHENSKQEEAAKDKEQEGDVDQLAGEVAKTEISDSSTSPAT
jgi:tRNAThr (cytosine32-N3)-methyltransferase